MKGFYKHVFMICALISCLFFLTSTSQSYYGGPAPYPSYGMPYGPYGPTPYSNNPYSPFGSQYGPAQYPPYGMPYGGYGPAPYNQPYNPMGYQPQPPYGYGGNQPYNYGGYYPGYNYSQPPYSGNYPYMQPSYYQPYYGGYQSGGSYPGYNYSQPYPYYSSYPTYNYPYSGGYYQSSTQQLYQDADEEVDEDDDGDEITLEAGDTLSIILPSNQSVSHWRLDADELDDDIVKYESSQYYNLPEGSLAVNLMLGPSGPNGREQWIFEADEPGTTTIILEYVSNYGVIVQDTFEIEVTVVED